MAYSTSKAGPATPRTSFDPGNNGHRALGKVELFAAQVIRVRGVIRAVLAATPGG